MKFNVTLLLSLGLMLQAFGVGAEEIQQTARPGSLQDAIKHGKNMTSLRFRYEYSALDGKPKSAHAPTLRSLIGWQTAPFHNFSAGIQIIDVTKLDNRYDDRKLGHPQPGKADYPMIADPSHTDINQLFIDWTSLNDTRIRVGRQVVNLDNARFIGDIGFRQVMQVFDGISLLNQSLPDTEIFIAHFDRVKQISTRLQKGDLDIINVKYHLSPTESLTGYGYFSRFDKPTVAHTSVLGPETDQSHKTFGLRLNGARHINNDWRWLYTAEYANQTDYSGSDKRIDAHYAALGMGAGYRSWYARIDHERLSSNDGQYAFQMPFGTNHLFQGWADHFLITPREGIRNTYLTLGSQPMAQLTLQASYHLLDADEHFYKFGGERGKRYGREFNVAATYHLNSQFLLKAEYAKFHETDRIADPAGRKADLERIWLTAMYTFK